MGGTPFFDYLFIPKSYHNNSFHKMLLVPYYKNILIMRRPIMALKNLADWNEVKASPDKGAACGTACGASKPEEKPAEKPAACGTACGAGKPEEKPTEKPSACGSACGAGK